MVNGNDVTTSQHDAAGQAVDVVFASENDNVGVRVLHAQRVMCLLLSVCCTVRQWGAAGSRAGPAPCRPGSCWGRRPIPIPVRLAKDATKLLCKETLSLLVYYDRSTTPPNDKMAVAPGFSFSNYHHDQTGTFCSIIHVGVFSNTQTNSNIIVRKLSQSLLSRRFPYSPVLSSVGSVDRLTNCARWRVSRGHVSSVRSAGTGTDRQRRG